MQATLTPLTPEIKDRLFLYILWTIGIFNLADYAFTMRAIYILGVPEANPVMDAALGTPFFALVKLVLVPLGLYFIWWVRGSIRLARPLMLVGVGVSFAAYTLLTAYHIYGQLGHLINFFN